MKTVAIGNYKVGAGHPLLVMAGPCVLEGYERSLMIGRRAKAICEKVGLPYVFKASFDKANRSSLTAFRGPGLEEGLEILKQTLGWGLDVGLVVTWWNSWLRGT